MTLFAAARLVGLLPLLIRDCLADPCGLCCQTRLFSRRAKRTRTFSSAETWFAGSRCALAEPDEAHLLAAFGSAIDWPWSQPNTSITEETAH